MTYKGYEGIVAFDEQSGMFTGEVIDIRDVITFQVEEGVSRIDRRYLDFCKSRNEEPEKPPDEEALAGAFGPDRDR